MQLGDAPGRGQAEAGSFSARLGREERSEDLRARGVIGSSGGKRRPRDINADADSTDKDDTVRGGKFVGGSVRAVRIVADSVATPPTSRVGHNRDTAFGCCRTAHVRGTAPVGRIWHCHDVASHGTRFVSCHERVGTNDSPAPVCPTLAPISTTDCLGECAQYRFSSPLFDGGILVDTTTSTNQHGR